MIIYKSSIKGMKYEQLKGFFVGWPDPPSQETHLKILQGSAFVILAIDDQNNKVIGFVNAISDKILSAYIPLLEVLPEYQKQGIGKELMTRMLDKLSKLYMIDLCCEEQLKTFYQKFGLSPIPAMGKRNFKFQKGNI
ncbi:MAG: GNAT family N-acetyltransferase [Candidatus Cloacimonadota bacterium]|nr:GNAT family N-acetyltransferase [Candidatus Cloacimonadota bacterium]